MSIRHAGFVILLAVAPVPLIAQAMVCAAGRVVPYYGWDSTECEQCSIYGSYLEYMKEPTIRDIRADGPGAGKLHENDMLVAVDGAPITTSGAWHRLRDAAPGDSVQLTVRREGALATTTVVASARCGTPAYQRERVGGVLVIRRRRA